MINKHKTRGQAMVEFALVVPIFLLVVMGIFDFGRLMFAITTSSGALRTAARQAQIIGAPTNPIPSYRDCATMTSMATDTLFIAEHVIEIEFIKATDTTITYDDCSMANLDGLLANGDILHISSTNRIDLITPIINVITPSVTIKLEAQRTIIKNLQLGSVGYYYEADGVTCVKNPDGNCILIDSDFDNLGDAWEVEHFGNGVPIHLIDDYKTLADILNKYSLTSDPDGDGCANGCEFVNGTDPNVKDTDADGLFDGVEVYSSRTNPLVQDTDGDGLSDYEEHIVHSTDPNNPDTDGDTINDGDEVANGTDPNLADSDGDGIPDNEDADPNSADFDSDGLSDDYEAAANPYVTDFQNPDTDGDGLTDGDEVKLYGTNPLLVDTDGDGLTDYEEVHTYPTSPILADTDNDGLTDYQEIKEWGTNPINPDTDGDGIKDGDEALIGGGGGINDNSDVDGDGLPDDWERFYFSNNITTYTGADDPDADSCDNICEQANGTNPLLADTDGDGLNDGFEITANPYSTDPLNADGDGDGLTDSEEITTYGTDPTKADTDDDGLNDNVEIFDTNTDPLRADMDGDMLTDGQELSYNTDPRNPDSDNDGASDGEEINVYGTYPDNPDSDGDGLTDGEEIRGVYGYTTNPMSVDSDNDGLGDYAEVITYSTNPNMADTDNDGLSDGVEVNSRTVSLTINGVTSDVTITTSPTVGDTDGDGLNDSAEASYGTNPQVADTDGDGLQDGVEVNGRSITITIYDTAISGSTITTTSTSTDLSVTTDPRLNDSDGDGLTDGQELNPDYFGLTNPKVADTDGDGINDGVEINTYGTSPIHKDTDNDLIKDAYEIVLGTDPTVYDYDTFKSQFHANLLDVVNTYLSSGQNVAASETVALSKGITLTGAGTANPMLQLYISFDSGSITKAQLETLINTHGGSVTATSGGNPSQVSIPFSALMPIVLGDASIYLSGGPI